MMKADPVSPPLEAKQLSLPSAKLEELEFSCACASKKDRPSWPTAWQRRYGGTYGFPRLLSSFPYKRKGLEMPQAFLPKDSVGWVKLQKHKPKKSKVLQSELFRTSFHWHVLTLLMIPWDLIGLENTTRPFCPRCPSSLLRLQENTRLLLHLCEGGETWDVHNTTWQMETSLESRLGQQNMTK